MPIANLIRLSILGAMPNGEVWSVNPVWQIGGVSTSEDVTQADVLAIATATAAVAVPTGLLNLVAGATTVTGTRVEARRWDGTLSAQAQAGKATPAAGSGNATHPFQTSMVFSLRTAGVGGSGRGRLYWPATGCQLLSTNLRPAVGLIPAALTGMKTYLTSLTAAMAPSLTNAPVLSVWSRTNSSTLPVNNIVVGDVLDTQRRRRDALLEQYESTTYP